MTRIVAVELLHVDLPPPVPRSDAIQSFVTQETPFVRIENDDGSHGTGYSYTIGTGGSSVMALLRDHLAPRLIGRDPAMIESIWRELMFSDACHERRRDHQPGLGGHRHRAMGLALPARRPALMAGGRRRKAAHPGLHHGRRLVAPVTR
jgi:hypothetical protein